MSDWDDTQADNVGGITAAKWNAMVTDQKTRAVSSSGAGAPSSTPSNIGDIYIDTTNLRVYISTGTSASTDWKKVVTQ